MAMNNSLAKVHPELVSEWSEKNLPFTPDILLSVQIKKHGGKVLAVTNGRQPLFRTIPWQRHYFQTLMRFGTVFLGVNQLL